MLSALPTCHVVFHYVVSRPRAAFAWWTSVASVGLRESPANPT